MNRVNSNAHHHRGDAADDDTGSESESESSGEYDPREFSSAAWSRSRMSKQKQPVTSSAHDEVAITPFVVDSGDRNILKEHMFSFRIRCTPHQEEFSAESSFREYEGCTILFNIAEVRAIHCTSIIMPKYPHMHNSTHNGTLVTHEDSDELLASLDIMPATRATNPRLRGAFNSFTPLVYGATYVKYEPLMPPVRFATAINYMHGMQLTIETYANAHGRRVPSNLADFSAGGAENVVSPDVVRVVGASYGSTTAGSRTLTFNHSEAVSSMLLRVGSSISLHGLALVAADDAQTPLQDRQFFQYLQHEHLVPARHHTVVEVDADGTSCTVALDADDKLPVAAAGALPLALPCYALIRSMQYRVYFQVEHVVHRLVSKTSEI
jgi:hypothetical protein